MLTRRRFLKGMLAGLSLVYGVPVFGAIQSRAKPVGTPDKLFPVTFQGKSGYIDRTGKVIISPRFDAAYSFYEGLGCVTVGNHRGYINAKGDFVIKPQFRSVSMFSEGVAVNMISGSAKYGYIDKSGEFVIEPRFDNASDFVDGLASVEINGRYGCIDKSGAVVMKPFSRTPFTFKEGLALVQIGRKWGYIDKTGAFAIPPQYRRAGFFFEGLACVGNTIWVSDHFIDKTGRVVISSRHFQQVEPFLEGVAAIKIEGKWGLINKQGEVVIEPKFDQSSFGFSEGLAPIRCGEKYGFIDISGNLVIEPRYDHAWWFQDGLAQAGCNSDDLEWVEEIECYVPKSECGYIDRTGRYVWEPTA